MIRGPQSLLDTNNRNFTLRHLILGLGRAPEGNVVQVAGERTIPKKTAKEATSRKTLFSTPADFGITTLGSVTAEDLAIPAEAPPTVPQTEPVRRKTNGFVLALF